MAFHANAGFFFQRTPEGDVRISVMPEGKQPGECPPIAETVLGCRGQGDGTWASVVSTVSHRGETEATFWEAMRFHLGDAALHPSRRG